MRAPRTRRKERGAGITKQMISVPNCSRKTRLRIRINDHVAANGVGPAFTWKSDFISLHDMCAPFRPSMSGINTRCNQRLLY
eukprot:1544704-Amphidinium_carterae.2